MSKPFYEAYANHAFRFYVRYPVLNSGSVSKPSLEMWQTCETAMNELSDVERAVVVEIFRSRCTMEDAVKCISREIGMSENRAWQILHRVTRRFAELRGLV